jgi:mono/diheme cytochrome c family protein
MPCRSVALLAGSLLLATPALAAKVAPGCRKSCTTLQANCLAFARTARATARETCVGDRPCRRAAARQFRSERAACRKARRRCRPCCALGGVNECARREGAVLPAEPQAEGDPARGRALLLGGDYMTCGIPYKVWSVGKDLIAGGYGGGANAPRIPDRPGRNADMPYFLNVFTAPDGAEVVNGNCLMCHGGMIDGQLVIGLGNAAADFTAGAGGGATSVPLTDALLDVLGLDETERAELRKIGGRGSALGPLTHMRTVGMNPAELFAVILMVHHDRETLAWSDTPLTPLIAYDHDGSIIADPRLTSDPPPWWRAHKKHALFYNGMARGDHRGTMALATSVCVDDVARARVVDDQFRDIQAFVNSVRAPAWPRAVDQVLAATGKGVFERDCAGCHGTYGARDEDDTYPNLLIPLDVIGTDPVVANAGVVHSPQLVDWYNQSFYGGITRMVPDDPFPGYMPPPLDGIWATAPYLHNGSVPTVELVLNSRARPLRWRRVDQDSRHLDETALGWPWVAVDVPQDQVEPEADRKYVYDTTFWSQSNAGHPFGDHLTAAERRAVIEYLKTL